MADQDPSELTPKQRAMMDRGLGDVSRIAERLYAGGAPVHRDAILKVTWARLLGLGVNTVISLTARDEDDVPQGVTREVLAINDTVELKAAGADLAYLQKLVGRMDKALGAGRCVYVHCLSGVSRTALALVAWEMSRARLPRDAALAALRTRRPCLEPNQGFLELLGQWEQKLRTG